MVVACSSNDGGGTGRALCCSRAGAVLVTRECKYSVRAGTMGRSSAKGRDGARRGWAGPKGRDGRGMSDRALVAFVDGECCRETARRGTRTRTKRRSKSKHGQHQYCTRCSLRENKSVRAGAKGKREGGEGGGGQMMGWNKQGWAVAGRCCRGGPGAAHSVWPRLHCTYYALRVRVFFSFCLSTYPSQFLAPVHVAPVLAVVGVTDQ